MKIQDENFSFIGKHYKRKGFFKKSVRLEIGDEVIIHHTRWGRSQATKSYPAQVVIGNNWHPEYLALKGIRKNSDWSGARINQYAFNRLEFVKRSDGE